MAKIKIGSLLAGKTVKSTKDGREREFSWASIALGNKGKDPKYDNTVEITVKDHQGKVIYTQTGGFINLVNPRTQPQDLLDLGLLKQEDFEQKSESVKKLSDKVKYSLEIDVKR
jgi:hypothetical protein